jgi:two-component system phosphate regulon response regulator PhoB
MSKMNVLVVEDDNDILQLLCYNLESAGFSVATSQDGHDALEKVKRHIPDLIILDLMIPGLDGFEVCKELKRDAAFKNVPVIMLTARGEEVDRIVGWNWGRTTTWSNPSAQRAHFAHSGGSPQILSGNHPDSSLGERRVESRFRAHKVSIDDVDAPLTATEFKLLTELIKSKGKVQTRDHLLDSVWGYQFEGYARTVDTHVRRLRQKLGRYSKWIETVRGVGYRFRG